MALVNDEDGVSAPRACGSEGRLDIVGTADVQILKLHAERPGGGSVSRNA